MRNSTVSAFVAYKKIVNVISNEDNESIHIESINRMVEHFIETYPEEWMLSNKLNEFISDLTITLNEQI
jgi:hypothetical protein